MLSSQQILRLTFFYVGVWEGSLRYRSRNSEGVGVGRGGEETAATEHEMVLQRL